MEFIGLNEVESGIMTDPSDLRKCSTYRLGDGQSSPIFGLGVYQAYRQGDVERAVLAGLQSGYKKIDTSAIYL